MSTSDKASRIAVAVTGLDGTLRAQFVEKLAAHLRSRGRATGTVCLQLVGDLGATNRWLRAPTVRELLRMIPPYLVRHRSVVRPRLAESAIVLLDCHHNDLIFALRRCEHGMHSLLARLARVAAPNPGLVLVLDRVSPTAPDTSTSSSELRLNGTDVVLVDASTADRTVVIAAAAVECYLGKCARAHGVDSTSEDRSDTCEWLTGLMSRLPERVSLSLLGRWESRPSREGPRCDRFVWLKLPGRGSLLVPTATSSAKAALTLLNPQSRKAKVARAVLRAGIGLGIQSLLPTAGIERPAAMSDDELSDVLLLEHLRKVLGRKHVEYALWLSAPGPRRKVLLQLMDERGDVLGYAKLGCSDRRDLLVQNELETLSVLKDSGIDSFDYPDILYVGMWEGHPLTVQSGPRGRSSPAPGEMDGRYVEVLVALSSLNRRHEQLRQSPAWSSLRSESARIGNEYYRDLFERAAGQVEQLLGDSAVPFYLRHGDFVPWNAKVASGRLFIFDWEYSHLRSFPVGDLFHFCFYTRWQLHGQQADDALCAAREEICCGSPAPHLSDLGLDRDWLKPLLLIHLLDRLVYCASFEPVRFGDLQYLAEAINALLLD